MKRKLKEETILFISVFKWSILAIVVGILTGCSTFFFVYLLDLVITFQGRYFYYFLLAPLFLPVVYFFEHRVYPSHNVTSTDKVIEAIHREREISLISVVKAFFLPILTIGVGGSAGKEAPCADVGAGIGSSISKLLQVKGKDKMKLMICGVSAGFASVFGVPVAGAIFGVEVLYAGAILYEVLYPAIVSGITAFMVGKTLGVKFLHIASVVALPLDEKIFTKSILLGIFFGVISFVVVEFFSSMKKLSQYVDGNVFFKPIIAGFILIILGFIDENSISIGFDTIVSALKGEKVSPLLPILKTISTSITLNFGGSGGMVTPILFIGSTTGSLASKLFALPATFTSALGFVCLLAGCFNTPISSAIMAIELFGAPIAPYAVLAAIISFLMTGHRSLLKSQVISIRKSSSLRLELGASIESVEPVYEKQTGKLLYFLEKIFKRRGDEDVK